MCNGREEKDGECLGRADIEYVDIVDDVEGDVHFRDFEDGGGIVVVGILPDWIVLSQSLAIWSTVDWSVVFGHFNHV